MSERNFPRGAEDKEAVEQAHFQPGELVRVEGNSDPDIYPWEVVEAKPISGFYILKPVSGPEELHAFPMKKVIGNPGGETDVFYTSRAGRVNGAVAERRQIAVLDAVMDAQTEEIVESYAHSPEHEPINEELVEEMGEVAVEQTVEPVEAVENVPVEESIFEAEVEAEEAIEPSVENTTENSEETEQKRRMYVEQIKDIESNVFEAMSKEAEVFSAHAEVAQELENMMSGLRTEIRGLKELRAYQNNPDAFREKASQLRDRLFDTAYGFKRFNLDSINPVIASSNSIERELYNNEADAQHVDRTYTAVRLEGKAVPLSEIEESHEASDILKNLSKKLQPAIRDVNGPLGAADAKVQNISFELNQAAEDLQVIVRRSYDYDRVHQGDIDAIQALAQNIEERYNSDSFANRQHFQDIKVAMERASAVLTTTERTQF